MRLFDVSQLYRPQEAAPEKFEEKPAPPWLGDIAGVVSGGDGSLLTLETVRRNIRQVKLEIPTKQSGSVFFRREAAACKPVGSAVEVQILAQP